MEFVISFLELLQMISPWLILVIIGLPFVEFGGRFIKGGSA